MVINNEIILIWCKIKNNPPIAGATIYEQKKEVIENKTKKLKNTIVREKKQKQENKQISSCVVVCSVLLARQKCVGSVIHRSIQASGSAAPY